MIVKFRLDEAFLIAISGLMRRFLHIKLGTSQPHGASNTDWQMDIQGAFGEAALAKHLNVWWMGVGTMGKDVGDFQIRCSDYENASLIVRQKDKDNEIFVLVTGYGLKYKLCGWCYGYEAKQAKYIKTTTPRDRLYPAYFVPQSDLRSMDLISVQTLIKVVDEVDLEVAA